jgi:ABC-type multidrug transport system fused ATPase/permease subunit
VHRGTVYIDGMDVRNLHLESLRTVSHRIASLKWVDRIIVLNHGVIEEQGTHDQLIHTGGLYTHLRSAPAVLLNAESFPHISKNN